MQNRYTKQAEGAIRYAAASAKKLRHPYIGTEHLLLGLRKEYTGVAGQVLAQHGVDEEKILKLMDERKRRVYRENDRKKARGFTILWRTAPGKPDIFI